MFDENPVAEHPDLILPGMEALNRRDELERIFVEPAPALVQPLLSCTLTWITALASSTTPLPQESPEIEHRSLQKLYIALCVGMLAIVADPWWLSILGGTVLVHAMRTFSSVVGHHMTHGNKFWRTTARAHRLLYDVTSALLMLPPFEDYASAHRNHHRFTASAADPDQHFIAHLGLRFDGSWRFWLALSSPLLHGRFWLARAHSCFARGPMWRGLCAALVPVSTLLAGNLQSLLMWLAFVVIGHQLVTLLQWSTEHLWDRRPRGTSRLAAATQVTFGRLLLPHLPTRLSAATIITLLALLCFYALVRFLLLPGDLPHHDLHHAGRGPWTHAQYLRVALIRSGTALHQTASVRAMFALAFRSAAHTRPAGNASLDARSKSRTSWK